MTTGIWSAASGATGQTVALDVAANNIANATTPGFRADHAVFGEELVRATENNALGTSHRYSALESVSARQTPGRLEPTGRPLDVALRKEDAFLVVATPAGERYTRAGNLQVSAGGLLTTPEGHAYLDANRRPITVASDAADVSIGPTGEVLADGEPISTALLTVQFPNIAGLEKEGAVLYRGAEASGRPTTVDAELEVGTLELSNVSAVKMMSTLVNTTRQFEMLTRVIDAFSNVDKLAATSVMKGR